MEWSALSRRERQVMALAALGLTDLAIAKELGIRMPTVNTYWARVRSKVGHHNRAELVAGYVREKSDEELRVLRETCDRLAEEVAGRDTLVRSVATYEALLDGAPEAVIVVDVEGVIRRANPAAATLFGWEDGTLVGERIGRLMPESLHAVHRRYREEYLRASPGRLEIRPSEGAVALRRDGSPIRVRLSLNATETPEGRMVVCFLTSYGG
ncbi:MAG: PAS domain S-box protein [Fimbriimonadaceae bacterium]|nr:PAS domain S-box protein [Fimbriimonadaceae bacterium]